MAEWLHVSVRPVEADSEGLTFAASNSNEVLRLQPAIPSGTQCTVGKGKGPRVLGKL